MRSKTTNEEGSGWTNRVGSASLAWRLIEAGTAASRRQKNKLAGATIKLTRSRQNVVSRLCAKLLLRSVLHLSCNMMQFNVFICCFITFLVSGFLLLFLFVLAKIRKSLNDTSTAHTLPAAQSPSRYLFSRLPLLLLVLSFS